MLNLYNIQSKKLSVVKKWEHKTKSKDLYNQKKHLKVDNFIILLEQVKEYLKDINKMRREYGREKYKL